MTSTKKHWNNGPSRRAVLAGGTAMALSVLAGPAVAYSVDQARSLIGKVIDDINRIINSGKSEAAMLRDFEGVFSRYGDTAIIGQLVLGADARTASDRQKADFAEAFKIYISHKYGRRFREFIGGKIEVIAARAVKSFYEVDALAHLAGQSPFEIGFVVADKNGKFIDMKIEGISLVKAERAEIGAMLDKRGRDLDRLIQDLKRM